MPPWTECNPWPAFYLIPSISRQLAILRQEGAARERELKNYRENGNLGTTGELARTVIGSLEGEFFLSYFLF